MFTERVRYDLGITDKEKWNSINKEMQDRLLQNRLQSIIYDKTQKRSKVEIVNSGFERIGTKITLNGQTVTIGSSPKLFNFLKSL